MVFVPSDQSTSTLYTIVIDLFSYSQRVRSIWFGVWHKLRHFLSSWIIFFVHWPFLVIPFHLFCHAQIVLFLTRSLSSFSRVPFLFRIDTSVRIPVGLLVVSLRLPALLLQILFCRLKLFLWLLSFNSLLFFLYLSPHSLLYTIQAYCRAKPIVSHYTECRQPVFCFLHRLYDLFSSV